LTLDERSNGVERYGLDELADRLHSSDAVKAKASSIYENADKHGLVRGGKSAKVALAASLYVASRLGGESIILGHIARAAQIPKRDLARRYRFLAMKLDLRMPLQDLATCVSKLARQINVNVSTRQVATRIADEAKKKKGKISGRNPMSIAAAALYVACLLEGEKKTQREIAEAADVTALTVRNNVAFLQEDGTIAERHRRLGDRGIGRPSV
jgi:transcription initiation factor TFIIB